MRARIPGVFVPFAGLLIAATLARAQSPAVVPASAPFDLGSDIESRSISFENPTGEKGAGGKAASNLGPGRKGQPARDIGSGETVTLCDIEGPGMIRHIWMTTQAEPVNLRSLVLRGFWDGQEHPSIQSPLGDFMGAAHGQVKPYQSAVHSLGQSAGMNFWLPMPFARRARFTITNDGEKPSVLFYQIDYTLHDPVAADAGRLHVLFRRESPTTLKKDFELLPKRVGRGRFIGSLMSVRSLDVKHWWGEGEFKAYLDGDGEFPTICGTGTEDYIGLSWGTQKTPFLYNGCYLDDDGYVGMYRWHLRDPIVWKKDGRITIQQIEWNDGLKERQDDWACATFWYEPVPSAPLPPFPDVKARTADVTPRKSEKK
jgi:D-arabinan exo alpha-(1,3)/(1,5)-arabinofuranosidase (non-reducing end)